MLTKKMKDVVKTTQIITQKIIWRIYSYWILMDLDRRVHVVIIMVDKLQGIAS